MARPIDLLGLFCVAVLSVSCTGAASAAPPAKKSPGKPALAKTNAGARTVAAVSAPAAPVAAAIATPAAAEVPSAAQATPAAEVPPAAQATAAPVNPYATRPPLFAPIDPRKALNEFLYDMKMAMPRLPMEGQSILPVIKTVHPTGEKPLVVVSFKCPSEVIGVTPLPTKLLHDLVNAGMETMNQSNLLAFNMQQVCQ